MRSKLLISVGIILLLAGLYLEFLMPRADATHYNPTAVPAAPKAELPATAVEQPVLSGEPVRIIVPAVAVALPVANGYYDVVKQTWTLSRTEAMYATVTPLPNNQSGNTFIYGHALTEVFGRLPQLRLGDQAQVQTRNGYTFTYRLASQRVTEPTDVSLFDYQGPPILTLQTCTGILSEKRQLFVFDFVEAI